MAHLGRTMSPPISRRTLTFLTPVAVLAALSLACSEERGDGAPESDRDGTGDQARTGASRLPGPSERAPSPLAQRRDTTVVRMFAALRKDSLLVGQPLTVGARGTTVILRGTVTTSAARERALDLVRAHLGTFSLIDSVEVAGPESRRPERDIG